MNIRRMKYTIASDIPGRLRIRCGRYVFGPEMEAPVEAHFDALPFVQSAKANHHMGSVLIFYDEGMRGRVLEEADGLALAGLAPMPRDEGLRLLGDGFFSRVVAMTGWFLFRRFLLPTPIRQIVTLIRSLRFLKRGWDSLRAGRVNVEVLDASAVLASVVQGDFGTASSIMYLLSLSELLEGYTLQKTKSLLSDSLFVHADHVWLVEDGKERSISMAELRVGDRIVVRTGTTIPVDGTVRGGEAVVNQASMTGEPLGVFKKERDSVFAGTVVEDGAVTVEVRALQNESRISQIVDLISESESLKASIQGKAERLADRIVPFSFLLALGVFVVTGNITKALSVLLVDYSCAIKLATPIAVISAMREASEMDIVVKGGKFLEAIAEADTVVFDKTGTLTVAAPEVSRVVPLPGYERDEVLRLAACMEEHFPHSVARAVVRKAKEENLRHEEEHARVEYIVAHGIATTIHDKRAIIGSAHFVFEDEGVPVSEEEKQMMEREIDGDSAIYLALDGRLAGFLCISDPPRPEAARAIAGLRKLGVGEIIMLTGDSESAAALISEQLGIDRYCAQILPADKAAIVEKLKAEGRRVIMVGDGINDSPALAAADVSVSMKDASDIAREVADITLLGDDLTHILRARLLGQRLLKRINGNFAFIAVFNTALLALGIGNVIQPATSALLHNLSTMGISAASMRPCLDGETPLVGIDEAPQKELLGASAPG